MRVQASDPVGDVFQVASSDGPAQLRSALEILNEQGGVLLYLHISGRSPENLIQLLQAHLLPPEGQPRPSRAGAPALREFGTGAQILTDLGIRRIRLLTNNPKKLVALKGFGLEVVERVPLEVGANANNRALLEAKRAAGHLLKNV